MARVPQAALLVEPEDVASYEMLPHEGVNRFHAFTHYRELPSNKRGVRLAWEDHVRKCHNTEPGVLGHKMCPNRWRQWAAAWNWRQRAIDWDREIDRRLREKLAEDQVEAKTRHKRLAEMSLTALSVPGRVVLQALQDPEVLQRLIADAKASSTGFMKVLDMVTWATKNMPGLVEVERLSLGMATESIELGPKPETTGLEIAQDPQATDLMIKLVSHMANREALPPASDAPPIDITPEPDPEAGSDSD